MTSARKGPKPPPSDSPDYTNTYPARFSKGVNAALRTMDLTPDTTVGFLATDPAFWRDTPRVYFGRDLGALFTEIVSDGWVPEVPGPVVSVQRGGTPNVDTNGPAFQEAQRACEWFKVAIATRIRRVFNRGCHIDARVWGDAGGWIASVETLEHTFRWSAVARSEVLALGRLLLSVPTAAQFGPEGDGELPEIPVFPGEG